MGGVRWALPIRPHITSLGADHLTFPCLRACEGALQRPFFPRYAAERSQGLHHTVSSRCQMNMSR